MEQSSDGVDEAYLLGQSAIEDTIKFRLFHHTLVILCYFLTKQALVIFFVNFILGHTQIHGLFQLATFSNFQKSLIGNVISANYTDRAII